MMDSFSQKKKKIKSVIFNSKICQSKHTTHAFSNIISTFQKLHEQMAMEDSFVEEWEKKKWEKKVGGSRSSVNMGYPIRTFI